jgi:hypothetical protein
MSLTTMLEPSRTRRSHLPTLRGAARSVVLIGALCAGAAAVVAPASASTRHRYLAHVDRVTIAGAPQPTPFGVAVALAPNTNLVITSGIVIYDSSSLTTVWSGRVLQRCNDQDNALSVTNTTGTPQSVTLDGAVVASVAPRTADLVCLWGSGRATLTLGIVGSGSTELIHLS